jgi:hypothetical protein
MKWFVAGTDPGGASCIVRSGQLGLGKELDHNLVLETADVLLPNIDMLHGKTYDIAPPPGDARWRIVSFPPGGAHEMHNTASVDFDVVVAGSMSLELDDGEHQLDVGDCVAVTGVDHAWRPGPAGCVMAVLTLGYDKRS